MSLTNVSEFTKVTYLPGLNNQLENAKGTLLGVLPKDPVEIEGGSSIMKLRVGDSLGQATILEGGDFPTPGDPEYAEAELELSRLSHSINLTGDEYDLLNSGKAAAAPVMREKMDAARSAMQRDIIRQSWGDGTGILSTSASTDTGQNFTLGSSTTDQHDRDRYIWTEAGRMRYDVVHGTTGAQEATGITITSIDETTNVVTAVGTITSVTADGVVVRSGNWATGGAFRSLEFDGVRAIIDDDNTYLGIDRTTAGNEFFQATVVDNSGTLQTLTEANIHTLLNRMARRADDGRQPTGEDYCAFASYGTWTAYHEIMTPGLRYTINDTPDIGWGKGIEMMGLMLYKDIHAPKSNIFVIHKPSINFVYAKHATGGLLKFLERGGDVWFQGTATSGQGHADQVFAYLNGMIGMRTTRPRNHGRLDDITEIGV